MTDSMRTRNHAVAFREAETESDSKGISKRQLKVDEGAGANIN